MKDSIDEYMEQANRYINSKLSLEPNRFDSDRIVMAVGALLYAAIRDLTDAVDAVGGDIVSTSMMSHERQQ